jgi:predicted nucleic acid-binding protein
MEEMNKIVIDTLAATVKADFILTGDKDLLTLQNHNQTKIVSYNDFAQIINRLNKY